MPLRDNRTIDRLDARAPRAATLRDSRDALLQRAQFLAPADRLLVQLAVGRGASCRQLAQVLNIRPGSVVRRLQRLGARLHDPLVLALLDEQRCNLPAEVRQLGLEHFLHGRTTRELADRHRMTRDRVRKVLCHIRLWHRASTAPVQEW